MGLTQITTGGVDDNINIDSNTLKVDGTNNRVGIGTASPVRALQIGTHGSGHGEMALASSTTGNCSILMGDGASGTDFYRGYIQYQNNSDSLLFATSAAERMRISSSGMVDFQTGIFGDNPSDNFTLNGRTQPHYGFNLAPETGVPVGFSGYRGIAFATNGSEKLRLTSDGKLGLGSSAPSHNLEVKGSFPDFAIVDSDTTNDKFRILHNGGSTQLQIDPNNVSSSSHLLVSIDGSEKARLDSSGNLGIGVTSVNSSRRVEIKQPSSYSAAIRILADGNGNDGNLQWFSGLSQYEIGVTQGTDALKFKRDNSEKMRLDSSGRLGLGTSSPSFTLDIAAATASVRATSTTGTNLCFGAFRNTGGNLYVGRERSAGAGIAVGSSAYAGVVCVDSAHPLQFATSNTVRATIDSSGRVGMGVALPADRLHVKDSNSGGDIGLRVQNDTSGANSTASIHLTTSGTDTFNSATIQTERTSGALLFKRDGNEKMRLDTSGRLLVGTTAGTSAPNAIQTGGGGTMVSRSESVPNNNSIDLTVGTSNVCYWSGFLFVNNINGSNGNTRTQSTFSVFGNNQGATATFTQIATANGAGAASFAVNYIDNGRIRFTNTSGSTCNVSMGFFGGGINMG